MVHFVLQTTAAHIPGLHESFQAKSQGSHLQIYVQIYVDSTL